MVRPERRVHVRNLMMSRPHSMLIISDNSLPMHPTLRQLEQVLHAVCRRVVADGSGKPRGVDVPYAIPCWRRRPPNVWVAVVPVYLC